MKSLMSKVGHPFGKVNYPTVDNAKGLEKKERKPIIVYRADQAFIAPIPRDLFNPGRLT